MADQKTSPAKAIWAFFVSGSGAAAVAASDNKITLAEVILVIATAIGAAGAVYGVTNKPVE